MISSWVIVNHSFDSSPLVIGYIYIRWDKGKKKKKKKKKRREGGREEAEEGGEGEE